MGTKMHCLHPNVAIGAQCISICPPLAGTCVCVIHDTYHNTICVIKTMEMHKLPQKQKQKTS